jgi:hypothetical protein
VRTDEREATVHAGRLSTAQHGTAESNSTVHCSDARNMLLLLLLRKLLGQCPSPERAGPAQWSSVMGRGKNSNLIVRDVGGWGGEVDRRADRQKISKCLNGRERGEGERETGKTPAPPASIVEMAALVPSQSCS